MLPEEILHYRCAGVVYSVGDQRLHRLAIWALVRETEGRSGVEVSVFNGVEVMGLRVVFVVLATLFSQRGIVALQPQPEALAYACWMPGLVARGWFDVGDGQFCFQQEGNGGEIFNEGCVGGGRDGFLKRTGERVAQVGSHTRWDVGEKGYAPSEYVRQCGEGSGLSPRRWEIYCRQGRPPGCWGRLRSWLRRRVCVGDWHGYCRWRK